MVFPFFSAACFLHHLGRGQAHCCSTERRSGTVYTSRRRNVQGQLQQLLNPHDSSPTTRLTSDQDLIAWSKCLPPGKLRRTNAAYCRTSGRSYFNCEAVRPVCGRIRGRVIHNEALYLNCGLSLKLNPRENDLGEHQYHGKPRNPQVYKREPLPQAQREDAGRPVRPTLRSRGAFPISSPRVFRGHLFAPERKYPAPFAVAPTNRLPAPDGNTRSRPRPSPVYTIP